jgi:steroid delta-isomerase
MGIIRDIYASDARVEDPVGTPVHEGLEAVCAFYEGALASGAKLTLTGKPCCAGNAVAFSFQVIMPGMTVDIIDVFEFDDQGKINSMKAYWGPESITS